ncbi:hypothetical protein [Mycobacterium deserti]|uniref:Uncharacterized protein n=1 Tax=Mycobacterium deserti TaxID=2978347 RepID=A0ABT2MH83_9MYCO|nr:hypothetical protein [Mycobacterium deserti]MCT7661346.1 hypothetical protein [Mycobacterium deserti]
MTTTITTTVRDVGTTVGASPTWMLRHLVGVLSRPGQPSAAPVDQVTISPVGVTRC